MFDRKKLPQKFTITVGDFTINASTYIGTMLSVPNFFYDENDYGDGIYIGDDPKFDTIDTMKLLAAAQNTGNSVKGTCNIAESKHDYGERHGYYVLVTIDELECFTPCNKPTILFLKNGSVPYQVYRANEMNAEETLTYWEELKQQA